MSDGNPPTAKKSEELKKAEEAAVIAKAKKEKADFEKGAAESLKAKAEAEKSTLQAELERDKLQATRELSLAEAQAGIIAKLLPKGETKPLEGKVETKEVGSMARLVAYHAMKKVAGEIAEALARKLQDSDRVMIVPQLDFASGDLPLIEIMMQFDLYEKSLSAQIGENEKILAPLPPPKPLPQEMQPPEGAMAFSLGLMSAGAGLMTAAPQIAPILSMAGTVIPGLANLIGYFKTDYSITGYEMELDKEGLIAKVAGELDKKNKAVYFYNFYTLWDLANLPVIQKLAQLSQTSIKLQSLKDKLAEKIKVDTAAGKDTEAADKALKDSQGLLDSCKNYIQSITTKAAGEDSPRLVRAALRDRLRQMQITHLLYLNVAPKSAGESITKRSLWRNAKFVRYLGGVAVNYLLAEIQTGGRIVCADNLVRLSVYDYQLANPEQSVLSSIPFD